MVSSCAIGFALLCITLPIFLCSSKIQCCRGIDNNDPGVRHRINLDDCGNSNSYDVNNGEILRDEEHVEQKYKIIRINSCP